MRILFLSHYFPPEVNTPAARTFEHCKEWAKKGHTVEVVTCVPNHPMGEVYPGYRNKLWQREERDGVRVLRVWTYVTPNEGFLKRTLSYVAFMILCVCFAPFLSKPDLVISTSPQFFNGLAGYFVSRIRRVPWVLEVRDLWPEAILAVGDQHNDLDMLDGTVAGYVGCPADADAVILETVRAAHGWIAETPGSAGTAALIDRFVEEVLEGVSGSAAGW